MKIIRPFTPIDTGSFTRASTATYFDSTGAMQTAAIDTPRFTYDPGTLTYTGLMLEAASTNLFTQSEFANGVTDAPTRAGNVVGSAFTGLIGTTGLHFTGGGVDTHAYKSNVAGVIGTSYRLSVFVRMDDAGVPAFASAVATDATNDFVLIINGSPLNPTLQTVQSMGGGLYRVSGTAAATSTSTDFGVLKYGTNSARTFTVSGYMLEATAATVSSYIPTTAAAVTRSADSNTLSMLSNVPQADAPVWSASTVYAIGDTVMVTGTSEHEVYESLTGTRAAVTISNATPAVVGWTAHGLAALTPVSFTTTGTLPTGLTVGTVYYVLDTGLTANSFELCATPTLGGAAIATSSAGSGVHTATGSTNFNKTPSLTPTAWLATGATNRWKMFDSSVQSQTANPDVIDVYVALTSRIDSVALINIDALSVHITLTDPTDGLVYDKTVATTLTSGIVDWYTYFFEPVERVVDMAVVDLPPYASGTLRVQINAPVSSAVLCGGCVIGQSLDIGDTEVGAKVGTQDYSIKTRDAFGNFTIVQRAFNKRANFTLTVESSTVDKLQIMFATYRASPLVWLGSLSYGATLIYGFYKSFEIEIGYLDGTSAVTLEVEGLI